MTTFEPFAAAPGRRRARGVLLSQLDRSQVHVLVYSGRRWETVGTLQEYLDARAEARPDVSAGSAATSTTPDEPQTVVQGPWTPPRSPGHLKDASKPPGPSEGLSERSWDDMPPF